MNPLRFFSLAALFTSAVLSAQAADFAPASLAGLKTVVVITEGTGVLASSGGYRATLGAESTAITGLTSNLGTENGTYRYVKISANRGLVFSTDNSTGYVTISGLTFTSASSANVVGKSYNPGTGGHAANLSVAVSSTVSATSALVSYKDNVTNFTATVNWNLTGSAAPTITTAAPQNGTQAGTLVFEGVALPNRLVNISCRSRVTADDVLTAGFVVEGTAPKNVLIRALGPTLADFGVAGALADPVLTIYNAAGSAVGTNDNWSGTEVSSTAAVVGATPLKTGSLDAATLVSLSPGPYTVQIRGKASANGVALAEVYEVP